MSDIRPIDTDEAGSIEVRVYRDVQLVHRELCRSSEDAAAIVERWEQTEGIECEVRDLSADEADNDFFEPETLEAGDDYPDR
jgi:hypothetical protein